MKPDALYYVQEGFAFWRGYAVEFFRARQQKGYLPLDRTVLNDLGQAKVCARRMRDLFRFFILEGASV